MRKIITIQHTQSEQHVNKMIGSLGDWNLTEHGIIQAKNIGKNLCDEIRDSKYVMYSSDLPRAKQTAEILSDYINITPKFSTLLREMDLGEANGKTKEWVKKNSLCPLWPGTIDWTQNIDDRVFKNAESKRDVWFRVQLFYDKFIKESDENIIIVSHDGFLSILFAWWLEMDIEKLNKCNLSGKSGGVSLLYEDRLGNRGIKKLNDMSYIQF